MGILGLAHILAFGDPGGHCVQLIYTGTTFLIHLLNLEFRLRAI